MILTTNKSSTFIFIVVHPSGGLISTSNHKNAVLNHFFIKVLTISNLY